VSRDEAAVARRRSEGRKTDRMDGAPCWAGRGGERRGVMARCGFITEASEAWEIPCNFDLPTALVSGAVVGAVWRLRWGGLVVCGGGCVMKGCG
jgi:hypothetical protein